MYLPFVDILCTYPFKTHGANPGIKAVLSDDEGMGQKAYGGDTVELSRTKLGTLPPLELSRIIENQNSDFVM